MTAKSGFSLIPIGAKVAAALVFLAIVAGLNWFFVDRNTLGLAEVGLVTVIGAMGGLFAAAYVLLAGYVYADASRRGMPADCLDRADRAGAECDRLRALLPASKTDRAPLSQLRMRSCARCCLLFQMRPIAIEC